jgi:ABC-type transporter Mla subunit MlaD
MMESVIGPVLDKALETVLKKVSEGKKLSTEDLIVLMLGLFRDVRNDISETNKRVNVMGDALNRRIDALADTLNKRIDTLENTLNRRIDTVMGMVGDVRKEIAETNKRIDALGDSLNKRIDDTNKRIDVLYELLGKVYETLIKQRFSTP